MPDNIEHAALTEAELLLPILDESGNTLPTALLKACEYAGWTKLTPVQEMAIPTLLAGLDIMVQSRTGSGKTGCYLLPLLKSVNPTLAKVQALVLTPTRELALQVEKEAEIIFRNSGISACAIYGGVGYKKQLEAFHAGVHVVIGTPGRILDHLLRNTLNFNALKVLVFDEADRMLSIGFYPDLVDIARYIPQKRQTALFSATYPPHVIRLSTEFMHKPEMISLSGNTIHVAEVEHLFCEVKPMEKDRVLVRLLEMENPSSAIIFCNTKANVHYLAEVLKGFGYSADELSADISQKKRESVLEKIRSGKLKYLVATDVAARGIDIPELSHVFLYEPPEDRESYIHRAGRTGRAGAAGTVISLVDVIQRLELDRIGKFYKINFRQIPLPTDDDVARTSSERLNALLEARMRSLTGLERMRINRYVPLARELMDPSADEDTEKLAVLAMLLDDFHRQSRKEPRQSLAKQTNASKKTTRRGSRRRHESRKGTSGSRQDV